MSLREAWPHVRDCIVGIAPKFRTGQAAFPELLGTGFFVSRFGVVCTCRHVVDAFADLEKPEDYKGHAAVALAFHAAPAANEWGMMVFEIKAIGHATVTGGLEHYLGPQPPDVSYLAVDVTETPFLRIGDPPIVEGEEIGIGGFPDGTDLLRIPGWLHQLTPTLLSGVVSAVLPAHAHPTPHGFLAHAEVLPGSSGSPVFRPDGTVVGMVCASNGDTSITICASRHLLAGSLRGAEKAAEKLTGRRTMAERTAAAQPVRRIGDGLFEPWQPERV